MSDDRVPARILARGVSSGLFLMGFFTLGWMGNTFAAWPPALGWIAMGLAVATAVWFVVLGVRLIRALPRMPEPVLSEEEVRRGRTMGRNFGLIFGAEILVIAVAAVILGLAGRSDYNVPVIALIVGLHFYPLGRLFRRRIDAYIATWVCLRWVSPESWSSQPPKFARRTCGPWSAWAPPSVPPHMEPILPYWPRGC